MAAYLKQIETVNMGLSSNDEQNLHIARALVETYNGDPLRLHPGMSRSSDVVRVGGEVDEVSVSLRFFGDKLIPEDLTKRLGIRPTESCRKGDIFRGKQYDRIEKRGKWILDGKRSPEKGIDTQLNELFDCVSEDLDVWKYLTERYNSDLFCGVFLTQWNRGFELSPRTVQKIAERHLQIGFDIYCDLDVP